MDIFDALEMIGGLCLFLFGMNIMGQALERRAGSRLRTTLGKMTGKTMTGFLTGLVVTAVIQSSSATTVMVVGFVNSGLMTLKQAIGVIMGANIGTTVTAWLLSLGGISGDAVWVQLLKPTSFTPVLALIGIIMYMFSKDSRKNDTGMIMLGFATLMFGMDTMSGALKKAIDCVMEFDPKAAQEVRESEDKTDKYEDMLGTYLLKLGAEPLSDAASEEVTELLKLIGDFERIGDHAVNIIESAEEMHDKQLEFSRSAKYELSVMSAAVGEVMDLAVKAFAENDAQAASCVEPLEQVVDDLKDELRTRHILRMKKGECSIEAGFVWSDLLTNLERASDHCSNVALCVLDLKKHTLSAHETQHERKDVPEFAEHYRRYSEKYALPL